MKKENQVCSLEQAKSLKNFGITQVAEYFHHLTHYQGDGSGNYPAVYELTHHNCCPESMVESFAAFSVAELGILLPKDLYIPFKGDSGKKRKYPQHPHFFTGQRNQVNYTGGNSRKFLTQQGDNVDLPFTTQSYHNRRSKPKA